MIDQALGLILDDLNAFLAKRLPVGARATLSSDVGDAATRDSLVVSVLRLDRAANLSRTIGLRPNTVPNQRASAFLDLGLLLMVSARFSSETEGWRTLSAGLEFLQATPVLTPGAASPDVGTVDLAPFDASLDDLRAIWSLRGGRYTPCFLMLARLTPATGGPA